MVPLNGIAEPELLRLAAAAEGDSEHPVGQAVVRGARDRDIELMRSGTFRSITGGGVRAVVDDHDVLIGTPDLLASEGVAADDGSTHAAALAAQGRTPVHVAIDGRLAGVLGVADTLKPESKSAIDQLHGLGLRVLMLSGDRRETAEAIARAVGIDDVRAEVRPEDKARIVRELQEQGRRVAMAGDGNQRRPRAGAGRSGHRHGQRHRHRHGGGRHHAGARRSCAASSRPSRSAAGPCARSSRTSCGPLATTPC